MPEEELRLEEQALSQVVEMGLTSQVDAVEKLAVEVHTNVLQAMQGQADSVSIAGEGVVVQDGIRVQELQVQTDRITINPLQALLGRIELNQPVNTRLQVKLTEADLNRMMASESVRDRLEPIDLRVGDHFVTVRLEPPFALALLPENRMEFSGTLHLQENGQHREVEFSAIVRPRTPEYPPLLYEFRCTHGLGFSIEFTIAIMQKFAELMEAPYFVIDDMLIRLNQLTVEPGLLSLEIDAQVSRVPSP